MAQEQVKALGLDSTTKLTEDNLKALYENLDNIVIEVSEDTVCVLDEVEAEIERGK